VPQVQILFVESSKNIRRTAGQEEYTRSNHGKTFMRSLIYGGAKLRKRQSATKKHWVWFNLKLTQLQSKELTRVANREMVPRDEVIRRAIDEFLDREKDKG